MAGCLLEPMVGFVGPARQAYVGHPTFRTELLRKIAYDSTRVTTCDQILLHPRKRDCAGKTVTAHCVLSRTRLVAAARRCAPLV
jgi:hypothetical protein